MHQQQRVFAGAQWRDGGRQRAGAQNEALDRRRHGQLPAVPGVELRHRLGRCERRLAKTGLGSGTVQNHTVYGRVPAQTTPRPGSYSDTVTATITF
ncbi:spore coat protein U domain-containing protein [Achromobacter xylosoxidans]